MVSLFTLSIVETLSGPGDRPGLRAVAAGITVVGVAFRRKLPLLMVAIVAFGLSAESILLESPDELGVLLAVVVAAFSVSVYSPPRDALIGLTLLSMAIAVAVATDPSDTLSNVLPTLLLFVVVPGGIGLTVHRRHRDIAGLHLEAAALTTRAEEAVDAERRRIARELHDVVSHAVTLIAVQAESGQAVIDRDTESARRSLSAIGEASRDALTELDRMLRLLGPDDARDVDSGLGGLPALIAGARAAGLHVTVEEKGRLQGLSPTADHCAYRVVQEGLTNALRHAPGSNVTVHIGDDGDNVLIDVTSLGASRSTAYGGTGRGLAGLRQRVLGLGGTLDTETSHSGDFSLHAAVPVKAS